MEEGRAYQEKEGREGRGGEGEVKRAGVKERLTEGKKRPTRHTHFLRTPLCPRQMADVLAPLGTSLALRKYVACTPLVHEQRVRTRQSLAHSSRGTVEEKKVPSQLSQHKEIARDAGRRPQNFAAS